MSLTRTMGTPTFTGTVLKPGSVVKGTWTVQKQIGEGGMSTVYAVENAAGRKYAMKVLSLDFMGEKDGIKRFMREAKMCTGMVHPNIIAVHSFGRIRTESGPGEPFLVMERLRGQGLNEHLETGGILTFSDSYDILSPVLKALTYAHEVGYVRRGRRYGIVHRDLKPENIFIRNNGKVTLLDFGIALLKGDEDIPPATQFTVAGMVMGTPDYMPPEQLKGLRDKVGPWTDVFALGAILYEMLSGYSPFGGESLVMTMVNITDNPPKPMPEAVVASMPSGLQAVLNKALAKEVEDRYQSVRDLGAALQPFT